MVRRRVVAVVLASLFLSIAMTQDALAYIDPGSGSLLLQLILGGIAGLGVVAKLYWQRFKTSVVQLLRRTSS